MTINSPIDPHASGADHAFGEPHRRCPPPTADESRQRWAAWHQDMELSHAMLMMGLRQRIGPDGDLQQAYRQWYEQYQVTSWETNRAP